VSLLSNVIALFSKFGFFRFFQRNWNHERKEIPLSTDLNLFDYLKFDVEGLFSIFNLPKAT